MEDKITYRELYQKALDMLDSRFEAGQLFTHVTQKRVHHLPSVGSKEAPPGLEAILIKMCRQRREGVPLQYLLGEWEFYGLPIKVGRGVLIPRQDTECLVEVALELLQNEESPEVLDLCSGTGCVAIAISHYLARANVTALELSDEAYEYLLKNISINECSVKPVKMDLHKYVHSKKLDVITCNPPYIPADVIATLQTETWYEPRRAFDGGIDGLDFYHAISKLYRDQIKIGGWLCFEVGIGQSQQVSEILDGNLYRSIRTYNDYNGIGRVVCAMR